MFMPFCMGFKAKKGSDKQMTEVFLLMIYIGCFGTVILLVDMLCATIGFMTYKAKHKGKLSFKQYIKRWDR